MPRPLQAKINDVSRFNLVPRVLSLPPSREYPGCSSSRDLTEGHDSYIFVSTGLTSGAQQRMEIKHRVAREFQFISNKVIIFRILLEGVPLHLSLHKTLSDELLVLLLKSGLYHPKAAQLEVYL